MHLLPASFITRSVCLAALCLFNTSFINGSDRVPQKPVEAIGPGQSIERELARDQRHEFLIAVPPGSYLNLTVKQLGIDVVLTIYRNDSEKVIEVDRANGTMGKERLSLILDRTSSYRLQIRPKEERAVTGRYVVEIMEAHQSASRDETRWSAEQSFASGKQLLRQGTISQVIEKYLESLQLWRSANDKEGESIALLNLANAYFTAGTIRQALDTYKEAEVIFQSLDDPSNTALSILYAGMCKLALGDTGAALTQYNHALQLFTKLDDQKFLAFALNEIGRAHYLQGQGVLARDFYLRAIEIRKSVNDRKGLAFSLNTVGRVLFYYFGDDKQALTYYQQALELQREIEDNRGMAQTLDDIGRIHFSSGKYQEALDQYTKALELQRKAHDRLGEAETLSYIGMVYAASGKYEEALRGHYQLALKLQRDLEDRVGEGRTLHSMGIAYFSSGANEEAINHLNAALKIWKGVLFRTAEAETRYGIARVEAARGNLAEARAQIEEALPIVEALRTKIANQYLRISYFASVQNYYELYIDVLMQLHKKFSTGGFDRLALGVNERARGRALLDTLIQAQADIRRGVDPVLLEQQQALEGQLTSLSQQGMLSDSKNTEEVAAVKKRLASLLDDYHKVGEQMLQKSPAYAALTQPRALSIDDIQASLDHESVLLECALGNERSYLWVVTKSSVTSYELPKGKDIEDAAKHLREMLTARNRVVAQEGLTEARARVERADTEAWRAAARLSEMLAIGKAVVQSGAKRLVIVADGELQNVPFSMLPIPQRSREPLIPLTGMAPLVVDFEIVMLPSVSVLAELRRTQRTSSSWEKTAIVLADPVFDKSDERVKVPRVGGNLDKVSPGQAALRTTNTSEPAPRLPFTRREAHEIIGLLPAADGTEVLDFAASRETVNSGLLARYRIVHFATHGRANDEYPELSGLLLSMINEKGQEQNGILQLHEIYNLHLPVDMVVLSACETGLGRKVRGEGLIGLTRGFIYAGAKRVVASAWEVNDASTSKLMKYFYQAMLKDRRSPAAALRLAQLELLRQPQRRAPYYWAAFMLYGEWQTN